MILHKISTSPFTEQSLQQCLKRIQPADKLLLIQDAVYTIMKTDLTDTLQIHAPIYVLSDDLQARGLTIENELFQAVTYAEFVALTLQCKQVISW